MKFLWGLSVIGALLSAVVLVWGVMDAESYAGEAAAAAIAIAIAVIPYCLARGAQEYGILERKSEENKSD